MQTEKGKVVRWNDQKGFGFIKPESGGREIFIHISALRGMSRNPHIGDTIFYQNGFGLDGRGRAINATIEGVPKELTLEPIVKKPQLSATPKPTPSGRSWQHARPRIERPPRRKAGLPFLLLMVGGIYVYDRFAPHGTKVENSQPIPAKIIHQQSTIQSQIEGSSKDEPLPLRIAPQKPHFQCQGKIHCSQMGSIEEAEFYLQNCPGTKMDGDNDGIPCERQFYGSGQ